MTISTLENSNKLNNINISSQQVMMTPHKLKQNMPISQDCTDFVLDSRKVIANIISGQDSRKLAIVGPCSIHDIDSAKEYALQLKSLHDELAEELFIVMRVYFEKPRTSVGWKGLINDPHLNNSFDVEYGLSLARELLIWLAELKLPVATEMLDPITPQYLSELISWTAIGARTSESQTHREMASGLSMPIGFKNGTNGSAGAAINAMKAAASGHSFLGINQQGQVTLLNTKGNPHGHVILRGGVKPNYHPKDIADYEKNLLDANLKQSIMVDCSHGNSEKDHRNQIGVLENIIEQVANGNRSLIGFMLESHLKQGKQNLTNDASILDYGVSITDACIDWSTTEKALRSAHSNLRQISPLDIDLVNGVTF
jgi:3-deoxy-7-phosphoheptulonate synthase